jgi:hypothetical protein
VGESWHLVSPIPLMKSTLASSIRWLCLNFRYRFKPLPTDPTELEKLAKDLQIPLAFTYRAYGIDPALAKQRIHETLNSFRWSAPLVVTTLFCALIVGTIISESMFFLFH